MKPRRGHWVGAEGAALDGASDRPRRPAEPAPTPRALALRWLARRDYSRAELAQRLRWRGTDADEIEATLDALAEAGYLSDARYAQAVVRQKTGGYSRRAITETLKAKGVAPDVAATAVDAGEIDDSEALVALWKKRFGAKPQDEREHARQVRFLQSRGFALAAILKLLRDPPAAENS